MRLFFALFVCLCLAIPAYAQSVGEKTGVNSTLGNSPSTADFVTEAAVSDMFEIQSSQLAEARGDAATKAFANQMISDHSKTTEQLKALVASGRVKATIPGELDSSHQAMLDQLKGLNEADFIKQYHADQVSGHKDAVSLFERYAKGGDNAALKQWAAKTTPILKHHLQMAEALDKA